MYDLYNHAQDPGELIVIPLVDLVVTLSGPNTALTAGAEFIINVTISHNSTDSRDARNLVVILEEYIEEYVIAPAIFTSIFSNGAERTHSENPNILCLIQKL